MADVGLIGHSKVAAIIHALSGLRQATDCSTSSPSSWSQLQHSEDPEHIERSMLTLHFLFPHELLPAIDLLDRGLLKRLVVGREAGCGTFTNPHNQTMRISTSTGSETFYIQSASATWQKSQKPTRFRHTHQQTGNFYEVRLDSWNCTCPAFAFSSFRALHYEAAKQALRPVEGSEVIPHSTTFQLHDSVEFGGRFTTPTYDVAICKHILAALIGQLAPSLFPSSASAQNVLPDDFSGWAGGWGER